MIAAAPATKDPSHSLGTSHEALACVSQIKVEVPVAIVDEQKGESICLILVEIGWQTSSKEKVLLECFRKMSRRPLLVAAVSHMGSNARPEELLQTV